MTSRSYVFTLYNDWEPIMHDKVKIKYIIGGRETCPTTGKKHWQGYVQFASPIRHKQAQKLTHSGEFWIEKAKGSPEQNITYCSKGGDIYTWGTVCTQGKRTDLTEVADSLIEGTELNQVAVTFPETYIKYHNGIDRLAAIIEDSQPIQFNEILYESQVALIAQLVNPEISRRKVQFVIDKVGGYGKSTIIAPYMIVNHNTLVLHAGIKQADAMYAYKNHDFVIIDVPRKHWLTDEDWSLIELFTSFTFLSTKYVPRTKYPRCKVIVFMNEEPIRSALSQDRYICHYVTCHEVA